MKMKGKKATRKMNAKLAPDQWDRGSRGTGHRTGQPGLRLNVTTAAPAKKIAPKAKESGRPAD